jgi:hypothetical protein
MDNNNPNFNRSGRAILSEKDVAFSLGGALLGHLFEKPPQAWWVRPAYFAFNFALILTGVGLYNLIKIKTAITEHEREVPSIKLKVAPTLLCSGPDQNTDVSKLGSTIEMQDKPMAHGDVREPHQSRIMETRRQPQQRAKER